MAGAAAHHEVGALDVKAAIHEEIFLFGTDHRLYAGGRGVAEQAEDTQRLPGDSLDRTHEGRFAVQSLAGVGIEDGGDVERLAAVVVTQQENRGRGVPRRVAARLEGGADAAGREGRSVGLALDEHLAGKLAEDLSVGRGREEGVVLFGGEAGHGLEPVGIVGGPVLKGPVLHGPGDHVGVGGIQRDAAGHGLL